MPAIDSHPSVQELTAFTQGFLEDEALTAIERHLADCSECQFRAAEVPDDRLIGLLQSIHSRATRCLTPIPASCDTITHPGQLEPEMPESLTALERYRVLRLLGKGGMGEVYQAEHRFMNRSVAIKVIHRELTASAARVERFRREVQIAARLSHDNIVRAHDADHSGETQLLVMEYIDGTTLGKLVAEDGPLSIEQACEYVRQSALGLQHAHELGLVHRDIKPENLILDRKGVVKVLDFGLASLTAESGKSLTEENAVMGTPDFMAPEQAEDAHSSDIRADIYSLGCTLYYLLTGQVPYPETTPVRKLYAHRDKPIPSVRKLRPEVPAALAAIVTKMMAKKPKDRYQTPGEVAEALATYRTKKRPIWKKWLVAAGLLVAMTGGGVGMATYSIKTDKGELVITTEDRDVEVVVKQNGQLVQIIDTKTKKSIALRSGAYELELKDGKGLTLDVEKVTLRRGKTEIARVERVVTTPVIEVVRRIPVSAAHNLFYTTAVSRGGKYALVTADVAPGVRLSVYEVATGKLLFSRDGYQAQFLGDGERLLSEAFNEFCIHETRTGKLVSKTKHGPAWKILVAPGDKHLVYWGGAGKPWPAGFGLFDLVATKDVRFWKEHVYVTPSFSPDGKRLFVPSANDKPWTVWDLDADRAADGYRVVGTVLWHFPDNKTAAVHRDKKLERIDLKSGKVVETLTEPPISAAVQQTYAPDGRFLLARFGDGSVVQYRLPYDGKEFATFRLPRDDSTPPAHHHHTLQSISSDGRFATVLTQKSLYVLRLPDPLAKDRR